MIRPNRENMSSTSFWVMFLGSPLMYKLASLMTSELGRAYDTLKTKPLTGIRADVWPKHRGRVLNFQVRKSQPYGRRSPAAARAGSSPWARQGPSHTLMTSSLFHSRESEGPWLFGGRAGSQPRLPVLLPWPQASRDNEQGWKGDLVLPVRSPGDSGLGALGP